MWNLKYRLNKCEILKYIYKYHIISLIIDNLQTCNSIISHVGFVFKTYSVSCSLQRLVKQQNHVLALNLGIDESWMRHHNSHESSGQSASNSLLEVSVMLVWVVNTSLATRLQSQSVDHNRSGIINQVISW